MLDKALIYAKENRNELKKVLKYYKNDKADTPNTLQPVNGMNDFLFASRFYKIAADSSYFRKNTRKHWIIGDKSNIYHWNILVLHPDWVHPVPRHIRFFRSIMLIL